MLITCLRDVSGPRCRSVGRVWQLLLRSALRRREGRRLDESRPAGDDLEGLHARSLRARAGRLGEERLEQTYRLARLLDEEQVSRASEHLQARIGDELGDERDALNWFPAIAY